MVGESLSDLMQVMRKSLGTVRVRTTAAATIIVGAALLTAAVLMVVLLERSLTADVRSAALLRAEAVVNDLEGGARGDEMATGDDDEEFVQVLGATGTVVRSSPNLAGHAAVARLAPGEVRRIDDLPFEDDPFLAIAVRATGSSGTLTVVVGKTLETVTESSRAVTGLLAGGIPLLLGVVGGVSWKMVGRALAPVEAMRTEVDAVSTRQLHRRVPDPAGNDEIARLATTMNRMLARLEQGQERQRRFVSDASHELRSPVATIRHHAEVALSHPNGTSLEEMAEIVLEEDLRLQHLVEDLLLLARADEGTLHPVRGAVDLDDILFEEAERLRATMHLRIDTSAVSAGRVSGDRGQLEKLVRNLVDNAARHSHGNVAISLHEHDGRVVMRIDDDGDGVPPSERERIFERFVRLDEARNRDSGGSGLGLAIVAEIAAAHGATVTVLQSPWGGARFEAAFPTGIDIDVDPAGRP
jgi:signal transduction histidine kinase